MRKRQKRAKAAIRELPQFFHCDVLDLIELHHALFSNMCNLQYLDAESLAA